MGVETHRQAIAPVLWVDLLDEGGGSFAAGIVHQHVHTAKIGQGTVEPRIELALPRYIGARSGDLPIRQKELLDRGLVDVADVNAGALSGKGLCYGATDACGRGGDDDPQGLA